LNSVNTLILENVKCPPTDLEPLRLTNLQYLGLQYDNITDQGLKHLGGLTKLKQLDLRGTKVTDEGVKALQQSLPNCRIMK
jgi:Leucine-rich repeat (LRR) protein